MSPLARSVRLYSFVELAIFTALLVVWIGGLDERVKLVLGWTHGFGWIALCGMVYAACRRGDYPWPVLAATVSPLGPLGSTLGIEVSLWRRRHVRTA